MQLIRQVPHFLEISDNIVIINIRLTEFYFYHYISELNLDILFFSKNKKITHKIYFKSIIMFIY